MNGDDALAVADRLIWGLARQTRPDDVVVVGVATPIAAAAALVARALLHPDLTVIAAASVDPPAHDVAAPMLAADAVARIAVGTMTQAEILDQIQRGRVTLQFVSPAQVDGSGALNTSRVPGRDGGLRRLPGGLATADIAVLVGRLVAYRAQHSPRFLAPQVAFTTGAGHAAGPGWRQARRLPGRGVVAAVTDAAVLEWADDGASVRIVAVAPGVSVDEVVAGCGFPLEVPPGPLPAHDAPAEVRRLLDEVVDPHGVRRLEVRAGRAQALAALESLAAEAGST